MSFLGNFDRNVELIFWNWIFFIVGCLVIGFDCVNKISKSFFVFIFILK